LSDAINSNDSTVAATAKAVLDALQSLDITQITNTAGMTIKTIDETDGKVSATFQNIEITESQVTNLTTHLG
jgi:peptidoglycan hydrolase CwlO-like protein